jgi:tetratricopeptide (TPR) repeat protein
MLRILEDFKGYEKFVLIRSFFREEGISSLDAELQKLDSFILIWDDLHRVKKELELINQTLAQVEQLAKDYGKKFMFIGASRMEGEYYQFKLEEVKLEDFRNLELIEKCSAYFGVSVGDGIKKKLLEVGDGTPFYVISLFATLKERDKERITLKDLKTLPENTFEIWRDYLNFLDGERRLSTSEKNVLRSIALTLRAVPAIDFEVPEKFYEQIFRGYLSEFDYALKSIGKKFFIGIEGEFCSMHAVQAAVVEEKYPVEERKIERLRRVLASLEKERSLILLWGFAYWSYRNKNYGDCLTFLNGFIEKEPNFAEAYNNRGNAYSELNQLETAINDYNKAIELNPNNAGAYYNRGNTYRKLNLYTKVIEDYSKAIENNPKFAVAYGNRGVTYRRLNQYEKAFKDFERVIELNPNDAVAYNSRGLTYAESNQPERAIEDYNKAIELNPDYAEAYNNRGIAYAVLNQMERAVKDYNKAIELNPNLAGVYGNRGRTYKEIGNYEESARDLKKASILFLKSRRTGEAVEDFSICFDLREEVKSDDIVYCGLTLFLITLNSDVIIALRKMQAQDETLRELLELAVRELRKEDVTEEIAAIKEKEKREEMKILLELLERFSLSA